MRSEHICPICGTTQEAETDLQMHLHVDHRKSELIDALVAEETERESDLLTA